MAEPAVMDKAEPSVTIKYTHIAANCLKLGLVVIVAGYIVYSAYKIHSVSLEIQSLKSLIQNHDQNKLREENSYGERSQTHQGNFVSRDKRNAPNASNAPNAPLQVRDGIRPAIAGDQVYRPNSSPSPIVGGGGEDVLLPTIVGRFGPSGLSPTPNTGSVYIRWGKFGCGGSSEDKLYAGYAAAAPTIRGFGGSTEIYCMPIDSTTPTNLVNTVFSRTQVTAVGYQIDEYNVFPATAKHAFVECAVCSTRRANTLMIPGWFNRCPSSWTQEYSGYLMSSPGIRRQYFFSSKSYCVDQSPDFSYTKVSSVKKLWLTFVQAGQCIDMTGPCANHKIKNLIGCTVCSRPS